MNINRTILYTFLLFVILSLSTTVMGQTTHKPSNEGWLVDLEEAYQLSQKTKKPILANFTGSDWCGYCTRLTRYVYSTAKFKNWAKDNVILLELDFPKRSKLPPKLAKQNENMQNAFQISGYPTVWVFDIEKDENNKYGITPLGKTGYTDSPDKFISAITQMLQTRT